MITPDPCWRYDKFCFSERVLREKIMAGWLERTEEKNYSRIFLSLAYE